jgi:Holliday junction resolvase RusA-like endonuclease
MKLLFTVYGVPIPQGSMKAFTPKGWTRPILTSDNKKTKPWRQEVAGAALEAMQRYGFEKLDRSIPVTLILNFAFSKPQSTKKSVVAKTTKPDLDKLARSLL